MNIQTAQSTNLNWAINKLEFEILTNKSHQSEGFPQTGNFIPAHIGAGAGQVWGVLPPALFQGRETHERRSRMWLDMGYLSVAKSLQNESQKA